jgi:hypothetical protein
MKSNLSKFTCALCNSHRMKGIYVPLYRLTYSKTGPVAKLCFHCFKVWRKAGKTLNKMIEDEDKKNATWLGLLG